jgi:hypothetical protein
MPGQDAAYLVAEATRAASACRRPRQSARCDSAARRYRRFRRALDGSPEPEAHLTSSAGSSRRVSFRGFATA